MIVLVGDVGVGEDGDKDFRRFRLEPVNRFSNAACEKTLLSLVPEKVIRLKQKKPVFNRSKASQYFLSDSGNAFPSLKASCHACT
ncbi:MAG: hypothetical protein R2880_07555 [Deinococcales bacterium]